MPPSTWVRLQVRQLGHGAPLLGHRSAEVVVVYAPAGGQTATVTRANNGAGNQWPAPEVMVYCATDMACAMPHLHALHYVQHNCWHSGVVWAPSTLKQTVTILCVACIGAEVLYTYMNE
jgi:hypothetical protein